MDFNSLLAKMRELDQPAVQAQQPSVEECGEPMVMPSASPMAAEQNRPPPAHPSMSVNINAQGMDDIEGLLKLMTKVNPDMINQPAPPMAPLAPIPTISKPPMPLGNLDSGPLKMLPDLDMDDDPGHPEPDADNFGGPSDNDADNKIKDSDEVSKAQGDLDNDGDHDMDDHDMEKKKDEEFANEPDEEYKTTDYMNNQLAGGMNRPKQTYQRVSPGDNPMAFRESIKQELFGRLEEAKKSYSAKAARAGKDIGEPGKNFEKIAKSAGKEYGSKERGEEVAGAVLAKLRKD